jgi:hypothetical protein
VVGVGKVFWGRTQTLGGKNKEETAGDKLKKEQMGLGCGRNMEFMGVIGLCDQAGSTAVEG